MEAEAMYEAVSTAMAGEPGVTRGKMFGAQSLSVNGKVFACFYKGQLVLKLPRGRVDALCAAGVGEHFDPGMGRIMKEWVAVSPSAPGECLDLSREACSFVAGLAGGKSK